MKEMGIVAWNWIAVSAVMGLLAVMIALGIGRKRGTWLHGVRLALWAIVVGGAGATAGCSEEEITGQADGGDTLVEPDTGDPGSDWDGITCYLPPDTHEPPVETVEPTTDADTDEADDPGLDMITCYQMVPDPDEDADEPDESDAGEEADV